MLMTAIEAESTPLLTVDSPIIVRGDETNLKPFRLVETMVLLRKS
jgi:hypothetical protein